MIQDYISSIYELHHQPTEDSFNKLYNVVRKKWSRQFQEYYDTRILSDIENIAAHHVKHLTALFDEYSGITTNPIEGLNNLYKLLLERKEVTLDKLLLVLYRLGIYYDNEIKYGFSGEGNYRLKVAFKNSKIALENQKLRKSLTFDEIINLVRETTSSVSFHNFILKSDNHLYLLLFYLGNRTRSILVSSRIY